MAANITGSMTDVVGNTRNVQSGYLIITVSASARCYFTIIVISVALN